MLGFLEGTMRTLWEEYFQAGVFNDMDAYPLERTDQEEFRKWCHAMESAHNYRTQPDAPTYRRMATDVMRTYRHDAWGTHEDWMDRCHTRWDRPGVNVEVEKRRNAGRAIWEKPETR
jgi:hypothetical protein